jgi:hypothetical protein
MVRSPKIKLAYAKTIETCLTIEHGEEYPYNPRSIQEDWSFERLEELQRAHDTFEHDPQSFSREQRVAFSRSIIHGQVCRYHHRHAERLHILHMEMLSAICVNRHPRGR